MIFANQQIADTLAEVQRETLKKQASICVTGMQILSDAKGKRFMICLEVDGDWHPIWSGEAKQLTSHIIEPEGIQKAIATGVPIRAAL